MKRILAAVTAFAHLGLPAATLAATPPLEEAAPALAEPVLTEATAQAAPRGTPALAPLADSVGQQPAGALNAKPDAGGLTPCLLTCYLGPRVGTEYNEGRGVATMEWISFVFFPARIINGVQAYQGRTMTDWALDNAIDARPIPSPKGSGSATPGGAAACFIGVCLGPRPAFERNEGRRLRTKEILLFVPVVNLVMAFVLGLESYHGKTMSQIAQDEGLDG